MAYDEALGDRLWELLADLDGVSERKMFGGLAFMLNGNMCCGVIGDEIVVRLGPEGGEQALEEPHTRQMDFTGRPMTGFVMVGGAAVATEAPLRPWVERAVAYAGSLPPK